MFSYSSDWIHKQESLHQWNYYWYQINILNTELSKGDSILEIGIGTRFTSNYLKSKGFRVTTIDIDPVKEPDIVANIVDYEFKENFDHVLAFEVFEHIPYEDFRKVLQNISHICDKNIFISLPRNEKVWIALNLELPGSKSFNFKISTRRKKIISKYHHWEVDFKEYTNDLLEETFQESNFELREREKFLSLYFYSLRKADKHC